MKKLIKIPDYIKNIITDYPKVISGRKNFYNHHTRVIKTIDLIKEYKKNKNKNKNWPIKYINLKFDAGILNFVIKFFDFCLKIYYFKKIYD